MYIPYAAGCSRWCCEVILDQGGTLLLTLSADDEFGKLDAPGLSRVANLNNGFGIVHVVEEAAGRENDRVCLADNLGSTRDIDGLCYKVISMI